MTTVVASACRVKMYTFQVDSTENANILKKKNQSLLFVTDLFLSATRMIKNTLVTTHVNGNF